MGTVAGVWSRPATNMTGASWVRSSRGYESMAVGRPLCLRGAVDLGFCV